MRAIRTPVLLAAIVLALPNAQATAHVNATTTAGDVANFNQKNLADHLIVVDSVALETAQLAAKRTQNVAVRDFATMLVTDYTARLAAARKAAADDDVGRQASASDTAGAVGIRALTNLNSLPADSSFDKEFVREQLRMQQQEIVTLKMLGGAAKDDDLKDEIKAALPMHERHLAKAREVAAQLNMVIEPSK
jgi:predicted outer membrane protein